MASGTARAASRANSYADDRMRTSIPNGSFKSERPDLRAPELLTLRHSVLAWLIRGPRRGIQGRSTDQYLQRSEDTKSDGLRNGLLRRMLDRILKRNPSPEKQHRRSATGERREGEVRRQKSTEFRPRDSLSDASQAPWNPEATLLPHTSAPLASRISIPPRCLDSSTGTTAQIFE
ncbi:gamma tubulin complex Spc97/GCP2 subunit Alp4 [Metarhizium acridum]|nr:gamma tubulin complex Spc97/GCP2 subunit Alp4 [Metarhizium acridum]